MNLSINKKKIQNQLSPFIPFLLIALFFFLMHLTYTCHTDDLNNKEFHSAMSLIEEIKYLKTLYTGWSSRLLVNFCIHIFLHFSPVFWIIGNVGMLFLLSHSLCGIFFKTNKNASNYMFMALLFLYPFNYQISAGWLVTTMTYIWPLAIGSLFFYRLSKQLSNSAATKPHTLFINLLLLIYCTNQEQFNVFALLILASLGGYCIFRKSHYRSTLFYLLYSLLSLAFHLTCPGNSARKSAETATWFPDYAQLTFFQKIDLGISSTLQEFFLKFNPLFLIFSILLFYIIIKKYNTSNLRFIAFVPLLVSLTFGPLKNLLNTTFTGINQIAASVTEYGIITNANCLDYKSYIPLFIIIFTALCVVLCLYLVFENTFKTILSLTLLLAGMATRMAIAFSPTVWASSMRTYTILYFAIIAIICMLIEELQQQNAKFLNNLFTYLGMPLAVYSYIEFLLTVLIIE